MSVFVNNSNVFNYFLSYLGLDSLVLENVQHEGIFDTGESEVNMLLIYFNCLTLSTQQGSHLNKRDNSC